jgi:hypothetical protein
MCNGELSSCIADRVENRITQKKIYDQAFIDQITSLIPHLKFALFAGGEPFIISLYYNIWQIIHTINPDCTISIQTNGTVLNDKVKDVLKKGKFNIGISLDSLDEKTYSNIRKNASLQSTLTNISYFKDYCKTNKRFIGISVCPMQENWNEIPDIVEFCNKNEIEIYFNTVWFPGKSALWVLDSVKIKEIVTFYSNKSFFGKSKIQKKNIQVYTDLITTLSGWEKIAERWEKHKPIAADQDEIKKLENNILNKVVNSVSKLLKKDEYPDKKNLVNKMTNVFNTLPDNDLKIKSLQLIAGYNGDKIVSNILREDDNGLLLLIKNIYRIQDL